MELGRQPLIDANCPVTNCLITDDIKYLNQSDVVVFDIQTMSDAPGRRHPHQRYVFYNNEAPTVINMLPFMDPRIRFHFFNWTMTYRSDSDIVHRYGQIDPPSGAVGSADVMKKRNKTKLVAWFVTHCATPNRREEYALQLSQFITVDIYGPCGNLTCNRTDDDSNNSICLEMLRSDYKFYLAFENSLCPDYVTEKLFHPLMYDTVPIVMGGVDYDRFAPPHSFIDVRQFESAKQLADYLRLLDQSDDLYARYFDWKINYRVTSPTMDGWCDLCQMAHQSSDLPRQSYSDIYSWWMERLQCQNNNSLLNSN